MELKISPKNPRIALDEMGNELIVFTGDHLEDFREIIAKVNANDKNSNFYIKKDVPI